MKRGILQLSKKEGLEAFALIPQSQINSSLYNKLSSVENQTTDIVQIQVSEEELEVILDNIGIPINTESIEKTSLRDNVNRFLIQLRNSS